MTADGATAARARSFGEVAAAYDRFRPAPPDEAVAWVLSEPCRTALDLGAGTGALTRRLLERATRVLAVEPDPRMLGMLVARSPTVGALAATAEQLPLASSTVDAVTVSSAWHWMDAGRAIAEIGRILRPGGVLGVVWNGVDRSVDWVAALLGPRDPSPGDREAAGARHRFVMPPGSAFGPPDTAVFTWSLPMTADEVVGLAGTYSSVITLPRGPRTAELDRIRARLAADPSFGACGVIEIPLICRCWRAVRH